MSDAVRDAYAVVAGQYADLFGGPCDPAEPEVAFVQRHLTGLAGPVLDVGCGPGQWTAFLASLGADVGGVDLVPEFVAHARAAHPGLAFRLGAMQDVDASPGSLAGVLAWYSTIHVPPEGLDDVLARLSGLLAPGGVLVLGFFAGDDVGAPFDHAVTTAYRWPVDELARRLVALGLVEVERLQWRWPERPDRRYAALAARVG